MMKLITGLDEIREAQTIKYPTHNDVVNAFPHYTKGYVHAVFDYSVNKWQFGYHETREDAINFYGELKTLCEQFPDVLNWFNFSEMYIYSSCGWHKATWALLGCVIED